MCWANTAHFASSRPSAPLVPGVGVFLLVSMFVNGVEAISSRLNNIALDSLKIQNNMHPNAEKTATCEKTPLPLLNLTPTAANQKRNDGSPPQGPDNPWLLKPQHEIPPTPPPKTDHKPANFFPQRIG